MNHGIYTSKAPYFNPAPTASKTIPLYIGLAPLHQLDDTKFKERANTIHVINNFSDAKQKIGYVGAEDNGSFKYPLSEVVSAHFLDTDYPAGPILVLATGDLQESNLTAGTTSVTFNAGTAKITESDILLSSIAITDYERGSDFIAEYDRYGKYITITAIDNTLKATTTPVTVSYSKVTSLPVADAEAVANAINQVEHQTDIVPSILCAPGDKSLLTTIMNIAKSKIDEKWYVEAYYDLTDDSAVVSMSTAKTAAGTIRSTYTNASMLKIFYLMAVKSSIVYHQSVKTIVRKMLLDAENGDIPYESVSNKELDIDYPALCDSDGYPITTYISESNANDLNGYGIVAMNYLQGAWRSWGAVMANYTDADTSIPYNENSDVAVQMSDYILNDFRKNLIDNVDRPMSRRIINQIIDDENARLNDLIGAGALLYGEASYNESDNDTDDVAVGDFVFNTEYTHIPNAKSITNVLYYSTTGLSTIMEVEDNA